MTQQTTTEKARGKDDGGPALACAGDAYSGSGGSEGMTLRDYFAAKAMQVAYHWHFREAHEPSDSWLPNLKEVADSAYKVADAMIEARKS